MATAYFKFKQFTVWHDRCGMKVGTDGVLLGAWAPAEETRQILDIGTGSGVIALQMAQRAPKAHITAVEIDYDAAQQAASNVAASPWQDRIEVVCEDFTSFTTSKSFDLIVSNPPYFVNALQNPDAMRSLARHNDSLPYHILFQRASELLAPSGKFCVIVPTEQRFNILNAALQSQLRMERLTRIFTKPNLCKRLIFKFIHKREEEQRPCFHIDNICIQEADGSYNETYRQLTAPFYLRF